MKKFLCVLFHILGYPLLLAAVLYFNWNIFFKQAKNYGVFVFVGVIVAVVMAIIYYICYAAITSKKKKKRKSIFNQTVRLVMVVVITLTGLWCVCDFALPDFLATATSSTLYYEDLADGWNDRADVNEDLLNTFIELSVKAGTLPYDGDVEDGVAYYQSKGLKESVQELADNENYGTIGGLLEIQFQSIDANGYNTFTHPWIDCATSGRLTIPCLVHLLLDERNIAQDKITNYDYTEYKENEDGTKEVTSVFFAVYDPDTKTIKLEHVNWTVLDMLGTDTVISLDGLYDIDAVNVLLGGLLGGPIINLVKNLIPAVERLAASEDLIGSPVYVTVENNAEKRELTVTLIPANASRGVLGYQEMAWLNSNGLIYALVTLFSLRKIFLIAAAWLTIINILIGLCRGMAKEEKEKRRRIEEVRVPEKKQQPERPAYPYATYNGR